MTETHRQVIDMLHERQCSCVICNGADIRTFTQRGVADLYELLVGEKKFLSGAFIADKVVGKGAAALMILGGVKEVFADTASAQAVALLHDYGVEVSFDIEVPYIINRTNTGMCPVETLCMDCKTPEECLKGIEAFLKRMNKRNG